jgi:hypothetical protein
MDQMLASSKFRLAFCFTVFFLVLFCFSDRQWVTIVDAAGGVTNLVTEPVVKHIKIHYSLERIYIFLDNLGHDPNMYDGIFPITIFSFVKLNLSPNGKSSEHYSFVGWKWLLFP